MWHEGTIEVNGAKYRYNAKVYDTGSRFGIGGGRVSKLTIVKASDGDWHRPVINYDRGWDIKAETPEAYAACSAVLDLFA